MVLNKVSIKASNKVNVTKKLDYRNKFIAWLNDRTDFLKK